MARTKKNAMELVLGAVENIEVEKEVVEMDKKVGKVLAKRKGKKVIKSEIEVLKEETIKVEKEVEVVEVKKEMLDVTNIFVAVECSYCEDKYDCERCTLNEVNEEITVVNELAENMGNSLEDVDALREAMCDEFYEDITSQEVDVKESLRLDEEFNQEYINTLNMVQELNTGIRNAIKQGKFVKKGDSMCMTGKELLAIIKSYKLVTGVDMSNEQILTLKKLNGTQAKYVSYTINYKLREIRNNERNQRFATV